MKQLLYPILLLGMFTAQFSCTKDDTDSNTQKASTSTTGSGQPIVSSSDYLIFSTDTVKQFNKSQSVVSKRFMLKATHVTSDPVVSLTLSDETFPTGLPKTYAVTQTALVDGKCSVTIMYAGLFYIATSGSLKVSMLNGKKGFTLTNMVCTSASDPQGRILNGVLTID